ncbi:MAG TPA: ABC transporter permease subunit, partial [Xanthomonadaceae bacterium]|nr:ABC transporter permease subunit [Xanthomonadaceae bacterium]
MRTFREIFGFELRQQLKSPLFWMVAFVLAALAFTAVGSDHVRIGGGIGNTNRNAPYVVVELLADFTLFGLFLIPLFVAGAALRDFDAGTAELFFATPMSRSAYLNGRLAAGFAASIAMMAMIAIGMLIGVLMPWVDPARIGPTSWAAYAYAFGVIVLPTLFFLSTMLFLLATLTRSMLTTYIGVIGFFVLFTIAGVATSNVEHLTLGAVIDPSGISAFELATRYWSANDRNTKLPEIAGVILANRVLCVALGGLMLAAALALFRLDREGLRLWKRRGKLVDSAPGPVAATIALPAVSLRTNASARWTQFLKLVGFDMRGALGGVPFLIMLAFGLFNLGGSLWLDDTFFGTKVYPVTHLMNEAMDGSYNFMLMIIVIFYAGELVWRERSGRISEVTDAFPLPDWIPLLSKLVALASVIAIFLLAGCAECAIYQASRGYFQFEPGLYLANVALTLLFFLLIGALALFLQVISNNKFLGYLLAVVFMVSRIALRQLDFDHHLYNYSSAPDAPYSDMNGYGHFLAGHLWFSAYWTSFATALLVIASLFWARGTAQGWKERTRIARQRFGTPARTLLAGSLLAFVGLGGWIYYNTNVINQYIPGDLARQRQADYEKRYRKYRNLPQPKITDVKVDVDIYPHDRKVDIRGHYVLANRSGQPITDLHVLMPVDGITRATMTFAPHEVVSDDRINGYTIYRLKQPLQPGATMHFDFDVQYWSRGFRNTPDDIHVVDNGTFFDSLTFPHFGYNERNELTDRNDRRKFGLGAPHRMPKIDDAAAHQFNLMCCDADWVAFETTVSTVPDQIALAPGYLEKEWTADTPDHGRRRYFHYRM